MVFVQVFGLAIALLWPFGLVSYLCFGVACPLSHATYLLLRSE